MIQSSEGSEGATTESAKEGAWNPEASIAEASMIPLLKRHEVQVLCEPSIRTRKWWRSPE